MSELAAAEHENAEWHTLAGKAILFFGEIELISIRCLAHLPADRLAVTAARLEFGRRVDLLLEILSGMAASAEPVISKLIESFRTAKRLADTRNLIAHDPVMLDLYVNEAKDDHYVERTIRSVRGNKSPMRLAVLKEFASEVEHLAAELWLQYLDAVRGRDMPFRVLGPSHA